MLHVFTSLFKSCIISHFRSDTRLGVVSQSSGSAYIELGGTKIICAAYDCFYIFDWLFVLFAL